MESIIKLEGISKIFEDKEQNVVALTDINLEIPKGEIFGIIGLSGAGKSTLVRMMNLLEKPSSGTITVNSTVINKLSEKDLRKLRKSIGMIFQGFHLLMQKNVIDNVSFPLFLDGVPKAEAYKRSEELLELVGLSDKAKSYPSQLSGGQKQRVAIARALSTRPEILLLDEATSALDPKTTRDILKLIKEINQKFSVSVVIITHEMKVIEEICHKVAILDNGRLAEVGTVEEIFSHPRSEVGKRLVFPDGVPQELLPGGRLLRLAFNGDTTNEPIISTIALDLGIKVNILGADTRNIDGRAFGTMMIELPKEGDEADKIISYFKNKNNVTIEEVRR